MPDKEQGHLNLKSDSTNRVLPICKKQKCMAYMKLDANAKSFKAILTKCTYTPQSLQAITSPYVIMCIYLTNFHSYFAYGFILSCGDAESESNFATRKLIIAIVSGIVKCIPRGQICKHWNIFPAARIRIIEVIYIIKSNEVATTVIFIIKIHAEI